MKQLPFEKSEKSQPNLHYDAQIQLAQRYHDRGIDFCYIDHEYSKAVIELRKAVFLRESLIGKYQNDTAVTYFRLACILREDVKDYQQALTVGRREFRISQGLLGQSDISTTSSQEQWLLERVQWIKAVLADTKVFTKLQAKTYCSQFLQAVELERVGDLEMLKRRWEVAIKEYNCALALESSAFGRSLLDMADLHMKIGDCLVNLEQYEAALQEYDAAQDKYQQEFGVEEVTNLICATIHHSYLANLFSKRGYVYMRTTKWEKAMAAFAKAYSMYEFIFGDSHEISADAIKNIRLVAVKEMEDLRHQERLRRKASQGKGRVGAITQKPVTEPIIGAPEIGSALEEHIQYRNDGRCKS